MRLIIACLLVSQLLACADREQATPSGEEAPRVQEPPAAVDTVLPDTVPPDTVMARDTAQSNTEY
jgi:hypothetical protein